ncbi:MAG: PadR family transcriptional regulator [Methanobacteriaceae archaeon]|jgi:DNA-binding PadR family transcriptional regulator|nr:PadR family transcriptional regulator [Candidatus Methanorudis spinitermitis]
MSLKHGLLGFLDLSGSMTGYDLNKIFMSLFKYIWPAQRSQIYHELKSMEKLGWVSSNIIFQTGKPNKKEYTITEEGKAELKKWLVEYDMQDQLRVKSIFLMKIFFSGKNQINENIKLIQSFKKECIDVLEILKIGDGTIDYSSGIGFAKNKIYKDIVYDFEEDYLKMCVRWADKTIEKLEKNSEK